MPTQHKGAPESVGHTPGPWAARRDFSSLCVVDAQGDYVADIHDRETYDDNLAVEDEDASNAEASANAHLIAAAPALYEALETASWLLADISPNGLVKQKVDAALSLARGEAK